MPKRIDLDSNFAGSSQVYSLIDTRNNKDIPCLFVLYHKPQVVSIGFYQSYILVLRGVFVLSRDFYLSEDERIFYHNENIDYWLYKEGLKKKDLAIRLGIQEPQLTQYLKKPLNSELRFKIVEITQIKMEHLFGTRLADELVKND